MLERAPVVSSAPVPDRASEPNSDLGALVPLCDHLLPPRDAVEATGLEPELAISNGGLDANWLYQHGIPTVSLGCGQINQHMVSEALSVKDFEAACQIALRLASGDDDD